MTNNSITKGILLALLTAVISGFAVFISKIAVSITDPIVHVTLRTSVVAVALTLVMISRGRFPNLARLSAWEKSQLILIGIIGGSIAFILFFLGLSKTSAVTGALIHKTLYIWVALLAISFLGEKVNFLQGLGYGLILVSNIWLGGWQGFKLGSGELMVLTATILWAIENIIAKKVLKTVDSLTVAWARLTIGALIILLTTLLLGKGNNLLTLTPAQGLTVLAGSTTLFFYVLTWYKALSLAPATYVSSILVLATPITSLLSATFITHRMPQLEVVSGILTFAGVVAIIYFARRVEEIFQYSILTPWKFIKQKAKSKNTNKKSNIYLIFDL